MNPAKQRCTQIVNVTLACEQAVDRRSYHRSWLRTSWNLRPNHCRCVRGPEYPSHTRMIEITNRGWSAGGAHCQLGPGKGKIWDHVLHFFSRRLSEFIANRGITFWYESQQRKFSTVSILRLKSTYTLRADLNSWTNSLDGTSYAPLKLRKKYSTSFALFTLWPVSNLNKCVNVSLILDTAWTA